MVAVALISPWLGRCSSVTPLMVTVAAAVAATQDTFLTVVGTGAFLAEGTAATTAAGTGLALEGRGAPFTNKGDAPGAGLGWPERIPEGCRGCFLTGTGAAATAATVVVVPF